MKHRLSASAAIAVLATGLVGCASTGQAVLANLSECNRHYDGTISAGITGGQFTGTVKVDCLNADLARAKAAGVAGSSEPSAPASP